MSAHRTAAIVAHLQRIRVIQTRSYSGDTTQDGLGFMFICFNDLHRNAESTHFELRYFFAAGSSLRSVCIS